MLWRAQAFAYVAALRIALRVAPLHRTRRVWERLGQVPLPGAATALREAPRALDAASAWIPGAHNCFVRALALRALLAHRGIRTDLRIGFVRGDDGDLLGHAWLERDGRVLVGDVPDLSRFRAFSAVHDLTGQASLRTDPPAT